MSKLVAGEFCQRDLVKPLCGNLQLDISKAKAQKMLGWQAPVSVDEGLRRAVAGLKK